MSTARYVLVTDQPHRRTSARTSAFTSAAAASAAAASPQPIATAASITKVSKRLRRAAEGKRKSFVSRMLNPSSKAAPARTYQTITAVAIGLSVLLFQLSTVHELHRYRPIFACIDGLLACIFLVDYCLRVYVAPQLSKYAHLGPISSRLAWVVSWEALIDALATFPYFIDLLDGEISFMSFTWLRIFRVFLLFKTSKYANAVGTAYRVLLVNREILIVCAALVSFFVLLTSTLLYLVADDKIRHENSLGSVPSSMYMAVLMLTGQGGPDGALSTPMRFVVAFTAMLSVPFFAIPAAMMTWGFEGEAERLASRERRRRVRHRVYQGHDRNFYKALSSSSSEGESDLEEYLEGIAGGSDDDEELKERISTKALELFYSAGPSAGAPTEAPKPPAKAAPPSMLAAITQAQAASAPAPASAPASASASAPASAAAAAAAAAFGTAVNVSPAARGPPKPLLTGARQLAEELRQGQDAAVRRRRFHEDALKLVQLVERAGDDREVQLSLLPRLNAFARVVASVPEVLGEGDEATADSGGGGGGGGDGRVATAAAVEELRREVREMRAEVKELCRALASAKPNTRGSRN